jgi:hypothetical protein
MKVLENRSLEVVARSRKRKSRFRSHNANPTIGKGIYENFNSKGRAMISRFSLTLFILKGYTISFCEHIQGDKKKNSTEKAL